MRPAGTFRSSRLVTAVVVAVLGGTGYAAPASAHLAAQQDPVGVTTMSAGRLGATLAALLGLAGSVVGALALGRRGVGRRGAVLALTAGVAGMALGGLVVATSDSGVGTGNGRGGGYLALVVGLLSAGLGALALARARRVG
ncbi:DUF6223 family protein [Micromonospora sp. WMMD714]|uniref:DUF6223 family protein n=1 Tax=Micromonospora sp. WMMD714 TaxID=3016097 RepID=UPI00249B75DE|nr:DUF6223 family protein [Micromonospora sp. WMMD714]WFE66394.1 DUF6223 family protein [Micromonospora sp. WMMD714]